MASCSEGTCRICFNDYNYRDRLAVTLPCSHIFCAPCLTQLRESDSHRCPVCRADWAHTELPDVHVKPKVKKTGACSGGRDNDEGKAQRKVEFDDLCPDHALPVLFWCDDCKTFACKKCVTRKQNTCVFDVIEDKTSNIKTYLHWRIRETLCSIQTNTEVLQERETETSEMLVSVTTLVEELMKHQNNLIVQQTLLKNVLSKRRQDMLSTKKYVHSVDKFHKVAEIPVIRECMATLQELANPVVLSTPLVSKNLMSEVIRKYAEEAEYYARTSAEPSTVRFSAWLGEEIHWTVNASNWRAAVLALEEKKQPKFITLTEARNGIPEALPLFAVAAIVNAARNCYVGSRFLDTFLKPTIAGADGVRLKKILTNASLCLTVFYGHLNAADIALLPNTVEYLGLAISSPADAVNVSSMVVWDKLKGLRVAVSTSVAAHDLRPLPNVPHLSVLFCGIGNAQVNSIRPAIDALMPNKRSWVLCLPKCTLTAAGARCLSQQLGDVTLSRVDFDLSGTWRPGKKDQEKVREEFCSSTSCSFVQWDMKWLFE